LAGVGASGGLTGEEGEVFFRRAAAEGVDRLVFEQEEVVSIVVVVRRTPLGRRSAKAVETVMQENVLVGPSHFIGNGAGREGAADVAGGELMWLVRGGRSRRWRWRRRRQRAAVIALTGKRLSRGVVLPNGFRM